MIGVIGGSGLYSFLDAAEHREVDTPFGSPSAPVALGTVGGREVAFLPRHGTRHAFPPHLINYRANLWALRAVGVRQVLAACAVGGLDPSLSPGSLVVPDQLVDRTSGRVQSYVEHGAMHATFADPYCPALRRVLADASGGVDGGTLVVVEGPRFSTRAESRWYAAQGWTLVNMTGHPEAVLARELGICYATIALVTDLDAGVSAEESVDQATVLRLFAENLGRLSGVLVDAVSAAPAFGDGCGCHDWRSGVEVPFEVPPDRPGA